MDTSIHNYGFERYRAPELLALKPQPSSDIYAVGAIGIQCLVGCSLNELPECPVT
jgi:serine/threonine protein kinase